MSSRARKLPRGTSALARGLAIGAMCAALAWLVDGTRRSTPPAIAAKPNHEPQRAAGPRVAAASPQPASADSRRAELRALGVDDLGAPAGVAAAGRWLALDRGGAMRWLARQRDANAEHAVLVVQAFAAQPAALLEADDALPPTEWQQLLWRESARAFADGAPEIAAQFARRLDDEAARTDALETVAYAWAVRDPAAAEKWIEAVDDAALREPLLAVATKALAVTDPDLAAAWLATGVTSEAALTDTTRCLAETWAAREPALAAAWAGKLSPGAPRAAALESVAREWWHADPAAATAWIVTLPERARVVAQLEAEEAQRAAAPADVD